MRDSGPVNSELGDECDYSERRPRSKDSRAPRVRRATPPVRFESVSGHFAWAKLAEPLATVRELEIAEDADGWDAKGELGHVRVVVLLAEKAEIDGRRQDDAPGGMRREHEGSLAGEAEQVGVVDVHEREPSARPEGEQV